MKKCDYSFHNGFAGKYCPPEFEDLIRNQSQRNKLDKWINNNSIQHHDESSKTEKYHILLVSLIVWQSERGDSSFWFNLSINRIHLWFAYVMKS